MTGLASKWATEPTLVQQAEAQDKKKSTKQATGNPSEFSEKREIASSAPVRKPLVSKWADAVVDSKEGERKEPQKSPRGEERHRRNSRNRRNSETRRKDEVNGQTSRIRDKRRGRNGGSKHDEPRERQEKHTTSSEESRTHPDTNEILPPMSKAAASFASRLGVPTGPSGAPNGDSKFTPPARQSAPDSDEYETTDDEDDHNVNEKQPMSKAGMSFAARLAIPPKANNSTNSNKDLNKNQVKPSTQKYMSPKQRREAEKLEQEQQRRQEQKQRDAKLQEEVRDMFSKMTASTANWADLEDE